MVNVVLLAEVSIREGVECLLDDVASLGGKGEGEEAFPALWDGGRSVKGCGDKGGEGRRRIGGARKSLWPSKRTSSIPPSVFVSREKRKS